MKKILILTATVLWLLNVQAQSAKDSTVLFRVSGVCEMCKERIEKTLQVRGVHSAVWDVDTKILQLSFDPHKIGLPKIHKKIAASGHDTELEKATQAAYDALPECCHYREPEKANNILPGPAKKAVPGDSSNTPNPDVLQPAAATVIKGVVLEENKKGIFMPLQGASVVWLGTNKGTITDASGVFTILPLPGTDQLVVSYTGYNPDTLAVADIKELKIILASGKNLGEVKVFSKMRSTYVSSLSALRTQVMTEKEIFKAACCNLSESFETNPSVDVSYNDAVTGSKQIQLLGLSGNYTQLTVENLPGPRGIATPLGLNFIAGPWVESIQLSKGVGSVVNGFESIAGQINVEMKKPEKAERLYANTYVNTMGKTDLNLVITQPAGKKWSTALLLHDDFLSNKKIDFNNDGFRDLPTGNQFSGLNRWKYDNGKGFMTQFGFKMLLDDRTGGETGFEPGKDKFTQNHYGLGISTERYEGFAKIGYVFPDKKYKSIGLQLGAFNHKQDSYFGMTAYDAMQINFYSNLIYQSIIGNTNHKFRTGISLSADKYDENLRSVIYKRKETVPGAFFEYTFTPTAAFSLIAGMRADYNSLFGWFGTPRLHIRYEPVRGTTIRLSAGRGQRTANIFAENMAVFVSNRQVNILSAEPGKAYGLDPEVAWNKGITLDQKFKLFHRNASMALDFFRNDFTSQVVVDLEDPRQVKFYNLNGRSYSNSFQAELNAEPVNKLEVRIAYRLFDVKETFGGRFLQKPLIARHRAFLNTAYETAGWKFDYTINYTGKKRIPSTAGNPDAYQRNGYSPAYLYMNAQVSKMIGKKQAFEVYLGAENLGNFYQEDLIISADQPFGNYFDASLIWGPVSGRLFYAGFRYKIK